MRFRTTVIIVTAFAIAMAYLESAVVVYLQRALSMTPETLFPLRGQQVVGDLAAIEVGREAATLVMLAAIGCLVGRRWADRLAWTAVAFGVWDLFYYVWLWVFIGWPHSLGTWDVLFLIPVPWAGPVWAPAAVSAALIGSGLAAAYSVRAGRMPRVGLVRGAGAVVGGLLGWQLHRQRSGTHRRQASWLVPMADIRGRHGHSGLVDGCLAQDRRHGRGRTGRSRAAIESWSGARRLRGSRRSPS